MIAGEFDALMYWIRERERIRALKDAKAPRPWTADPILRDWRFCNVNRCDDTVTRWIFSRVIEPHRSSPLLWFNLAIARLINWPATLAALGYFDEWNPGRFVAVLNDVRGKVFTGAYMIPAGPKGVNKARFLADVVLAPLWGWRSSAPARWGATCEAWAAFLLKAPALGDFLVNQVVTDMRYAPHLADATDWETFVLAGPGTTRGLNRIHGRSLGASWKPGAAASAIMELRRAVVAAEPSIAPIMRDPNNLSNCLCEFDKYKRVQLGEGKPRARYEPAGLDLFGGLA